MRHLFKSILWTVGLMLTLLATLTALDVDPLRSMVGRAAPVLMIGPLVLFGLITHTFGLWKAVFRFLK